MAKRSEADHCPVLRTGRSRELGRLVSAAGSVCPAVTGGHGHPYSAARTFAEDIVRLPVPPTHEPTSPRRCGLLPCSSGSQSVILALICGELGSIPTVCRSK